MVDVEPQLVRTLQRRAGDLLAAEQKRRRDGGLGAITGESERQAGREFIHTAIAEHAHSLVEAGQQPLNIDTETGLAHAVEARAFGAGTLQHLIDDESIENIDINGADNVWVTYADGTVTRVDPVADSDDELIEQVQVLGAHAGLSARPFDPANPELDLRLPDGSRLSALQQATVRPAVSIRRHRLDRVTLDDLIDNKTMSPEVGAFLAAAVTAKLNIMIAGATNAGKTTLLRALASQFQPHERLFTVERALELGLHENADRHPNVVAAEQILPNSEGAGGVTMGELVRRSLRHNPDRVIVGEVLGDEIVTMLNAMTQGNNGSLSTIHAESAEVAIHERIGTYAKQAQESLDFDVSGRLTAAGLDVVVFLDKDHTQRRAVREVLEVVGFNGDQATTSTLFADDGSGQASRCHDVAVSPAASQALERAGWSELGGWSS